MQRDHIEPVQRLCNDIHVDPHLDGVRADVFLVRKIPRLSRTKAHRIVADGDLRRNEVALRPSSRVHALEALQLWRTPRPEPDAPESYTVLYDDGDILAIDKPAGLAVHPSARYFYGTLTQLLKRQYAAQGQDAVLPHPCHRLDRETSGVLVLARSREAERSIKQAFKRGTAKKTYLALVEGVVEDAVFAVDVPLAPGTSAIHIKMAHVVGAPMAITEFRTLWRGDTRSLLACHPLTGRTHQIRAHLAHIGHPVVGDKIYGIQGENWFLRRAAEGDIATSVTELAWPRHCLHAYALTLELAAPQRVLNFHAPWPADLPSIVDVDVTPKLLFDQRRDALTAAEL